MPHPAAESPWQTIALLVITSGKVALLDPSTFDALDFPVPRGEYTLQIKTVHYDEEPFPRVSRLRALCQETAEAGESLGTIGVDAATLAITDANALHPDFSEEWESHESEIESAWQSVDLHGTTRWGDTDEATITFATTGFGDGAFPVTALLTNNKRTGFEVTFIPPGTPYPFGK